jgi:hypothetical protein
MKTPLTFLLSLTFLFLFSGTSLAGIFSPDDYNECVLKNIKNAKNILAIVETESACKSKFPNKTKKGPSGIFGPKNYGDCILKYGKGLTDMYATSIITNACRDKFKKSYEDGKVGLEINEEGKVKVGETTKDINSDSGTVSVLSSDEYYNMLHPTVSTTPKDLNKSFDSLYKGHAPTVSTTPVVSTPYNK